ncbi:MAG: hypothetical protein DME19_17370 [Verrucomicrobia bacterium]|nr:MAG: hypothetical protein DME19_17370 [Verrucomicrobiota bacterium]
MSPNPEKPPDDAMHEEQKTRSATPPTDALRKKRAPTLYAIIVIKLLKGMLFVALAIMAYTLSDNDLPAEYRHLLHLLRVNPERKFFADLALQIGRLTEASVLWAAAGTLVYSLFSLVEGVGLIFRVPWACWLSIGESAFFIPIEVYELVHRANRERFPWVVFAILVINVVIVWYLLQNRHRLFRHHHLHHDAQ